MNLATLTDQTRKAIKMITKTMFTAWNGETYANLGGLFDAITELETDLDHEERLRVAVWAWNNHESVNADTIGQLIETEQEQFAGHFDSVDDFVQDLLLNGDYLKDVPDWVVLDYQATWDSALRFDYFDYDIIDIDGVFRKFYWRAY